MSNIITIVGLDPSLRNTGLAAARYDINTGNWKVYKIGLVQTENQAGKVVRKSSDDYRCAKELITGVNAFVRAVGASFVCAEVPTGAQDARAAFSFGLCCGVLAAVNAPLIQVNPKEVKMASVGKASATKGEMIGWAVESWPEVEWRRRKLKGALVLVNDNEHPADACAAIAAGLQTAQFAQALSLMHAMQPTAA
jgi:Holliday junction resolvasome RuvABC endonuclease subunit